MADQPESMPGGSRRRKNKTTGATGLREAEDSLPTQASTSKPSSKSRSRSRSKSATVDLNTSIVEPSASTIGTGSGGKPRRKYTKKSTDKVTELFSAPSQTEAGEPAVLPSEAQAVAPLGAKGKRTYSRRKATSSTSASTSGASLSGAVKIDILDLPSQLAPEKKPRKKAERKKREPKKVQKKEENSNIKTSARCRSRSGQKKGSSNKRSSSESLDITPAAVVDLSISLPGPSSVLGEGARASLSETGVPAKKRCLRSSSSDKAEEDVCVPGTSAATDQVAGFEVPTQQRKGKGSGDKKKKEKKEKASGSKRSSRSKKTGSCASSSGRQASTVGIAREVTVAAAAAGGLSVRGLQPACSASNHPAGDRELTPKPSTSQSYLDTMASQDGSGTGTNSGGGGGSGGAGARPRDEANANQAVEAVNFGSLGMAGAGLDNDGDETDMGRLQALLEARGLPSHLFGALGPRMHQLLHRSMSGGTMSKVQTLLQGLQATGDEDQQLSSVMEMCQVLVMGTEDSLVGYPVKQVVPALITLLQMEHNFDIMNHACRALTYMMEALPRSTAVVVDAVPVFLEKLQVIQCMDVAEQSLSALEMLSKRHSKNILQHNGIAACLMYIDFFSVGAQRNALLVTANCVQNMTHDEFKCISESVSTLSSRLSHSDKKSVESVCLCFARLVDNFQNDQRILKEISVHGLLTNIQQLVMISPPVISSSVFVMVIRMLAIMCASCPDLAVILLKQKIAETLCFLLTGSSEQQCGANIELVPRTPQELYELVCLIGELLPKLPSDGVFAIDAMLRKGPNLHNEAVTWQWQDDRGVWHSYAPIDSKIIEAAYQGGEDETCLQASGRSYTVDFNSMQQINEDTGTARPVQRKLNPLTPGQNNASSSTDDPNVERCDSRAEILKEDYELASTFIQTLFSVLYEVYSSSAGPNIRHKCLQTILRMIYYASPDLLRQVLKTQPVSSHIAAMMASPDLKVVVGAFQMADILMQKLPDIFGTYFRREGVMHQVKKITQTMSVSSTPSNVVPSTTATPSPSPSPSLPPTSSTSATSAAATGKTPMLVDSAPMASPLNMSGTTPSASSSTHSMEGMDRRDTPDSSSSATLLTGASPQVEEAGSSAHIAHVSLHRRISDMLKRKRPPKRSGPTRKGKGEESAVDAGTKNTSTTTSRSSLGRGKSSSGKEPKSSGSGSKMSSFLPNLNPRTWGRLSGSSERNAQAKQDMAIPKPVVNQNAINKEKVRAWIKEQAIRFLEKYFPVDSASAHPAHGVLNRLTAASKALSVEDTNGLSCLKAIADVMRNSDVSPFEVIHSGTINALLHYLTAQSSVVDRDLRLRQFLHVFLNCPTPDVNYVKEQPSCASPPNLSFLLTKLMGCLHQLEQFQVKVHDLPGGSSASGRGSNAMKFFSTHQLKCQLQRHPSCTNLKQWKGGPVKIDPLALVQAIERYLLMRGYGQAKDGDEDISDEDNSDDDMEDSMAAMVISQGSVRHRLEFLIGDRLLPYNMTVYQAIRQHTPPSDRDPTDTEQDAENPLGNTGIWVQTHTIWYRPASDQDSSTATSPKKTKSECKSSRSSKKKDSASPCPITVPILYTYLTDRLPSFVTVSDASLETIALLRVLHAINRHWDSLYDVSFFPEPILSASEFISSKLTAKATRQLQDPIIIMTGNLPSWLNQIGNAAPFLFPFDTRQLLFFATAFDRDRAMMRLQQDNAGDNNTHENERVAPRLDKRKKTVSRQDLLKQAEKVIEELGNNKALLEIQYEGEVGTGLGPTLEFYALVSKELQRADLELWKGEHVQATSQTEPDSKVDYIHTSKGLFPAPLARNAKTAHVNKMKAKFKFLGKFMAKALMDSRMIDIPLSLVFYKWMLLQEHSLNSTDLHHIDPIMARSFQQLESILHQKKRIYADHSLSEDARQQAFEKLSLDGVSIEDLDLFFVLPGTTIELKKGGKDTQVTLANLSEYLQLVIHWSLVEGVSRQFEAFKEGFESVFPLSTLQCFYPEELELVFCGSQWGPWDVKMLMENCRPDHGYTHDSMAIQHFYQLLSTYDSQHQRDFLQFVTGSPRLPIGGFRSLNPPLTIVRKTFDAGMNPDDFLPSVMTCVNYLKLPDYTSVEIMREKLYVASKEGQLSFHLS